MENANASLADWWTAMTAAIALLLGAVPVRADDDAQEARQLVEKAKLTVETFQTDRNMETLRDLAKKAKGMLILPQMLRGAFIVGASGGSGVLVARGREVRAVARPRLSHPRGCELRVPGGRRRGRGHHPGDDRARVTKLLSPQVKLGADISVAAGPVGAGAAAATAGLSADLVSYSVSKGLYGGFSVDGAVAGVRTALNQAYYGKPVTPADILIKGTVKNPQANALLGAVAKLAGGR